VTIVCNGERLEALAGATVSSLLETLGIASGRVAVEVNSRIVRRDEFPRLALRDNDRVELVHLVGGG